MIIEFEEPMVSISKSQLDKRIAEEKSEVAREIFEEIEVIIRKYDEYHKYQLMLDFAELKKKYTGKRNEKE